jgi:hypothetical protein
MTRVVCDFCGLPFHVPRAAEGAAHYCCAGCALAARIPVAHGQLPVSRPVLAALGLGFGLFNQSLFAVLGAAVAAEGRAETGEKLALVALVLGAVVLAGALAAAALPPSRRWTDLAAAALAASGGVWAASAVPNAPVAAAGWLLVANLGLAAWLARGWARRAVVAILRPGVHRGPSSPP